MTRAPFDERLQAAKAALSSASDRHEARAAEPARAPAPAQPPQPDIYFAAVPFNRNSEGELVAGRAVKQPSAGAAEGAARQMAKTADGAIAFSRAGDAAQGLFQDMVVLRVFGETPSNGVTPKPA